MAPPLLVSSSRRPLTPNLLGSVRRGPPFPTYTEDDQSNPSSHQPVRDEAGKATSLDLSATSLSWAWLGGGCPAERPREDASSRRPAAGLGLGRPGRGPRADGGLARGRARGHLGVDQEATGREREEEGTRRFVVDLSPIFRGWFSQIFGSFGVIRGALEALGGPQRLPEVPGGFRCLVDLSLIVRGFTFGSWGPFFGPGARRSEPPARDRYRRRGQGPLGTSRALSPSRREQKSRRETWRRRGTVSGLLEARWRSRLAILTYLVRSWRPS